jgi:hypothetical protein
LEVRSTLAHWWYAFANAVGIFIEEAAFRTTLAWAVLRGTSPKPVEKRWWNAEAEAPVLVDVYSWVDERRIFSVLVWPALEVSPLRDASYALRERAKLVREVIARGAAEMAWGTRFEVDYGLQWDRRRQVWVASDGFAYAPPEDGRTKDEQQR